MNNMDPDRKDITLTLQLRFGFIAFLISLAAIGIYSQVKEEQRDTFNFGATAFGVSIAGANAIHAYRESLQNRKIEIKARQESQQFARDSIVLDRSVEYIRQWSSKDLRKARATVREVIKNADDKSIYKYLENQPEEFVAVTDMLNFLEEMSFLILQKDLNERKLFVYYKDIFHDVNFNFRRFIKKRREEKGNDNYQYFLELSSQWSSSNGHPPQLEDG